MTQQAEAIEKLTGLWHNQHGSQINLVIHEDGHLSGTFKSGVGPARQEPVEFAQQALQGQR